MKNHYLKYTAEQIDGLLDAVHDKTIYDDATQQEHGLLSTIDKTKIDELDPQKGAEPISAEEIRVLLDETNSNGGENEQENETQETV